MCSKKLLTEGPVTIAEAANLLPGRPHKNTLRRWCHRGFRGVLLRSFYSGNALCTTHAAIEEFLAAINSSSATSPTSKAHNLAEKKLDAMGIK